MDAIFKNRFTITNDEYDECLIHDIIDVFNEYGVYTRKLVKDFILSKNIDFIHNKRLIGAGRGAPQGVFIGLRMKNNQEINPLEEPLKKREQKKLNKLPEPIKPVKTIEDKTITVNNEPVKKKKKEVFSIDTSNRFNKLDKLIGEMKSISDSTVKTYQGALKRLRKHDVDYHSFDETIKVMNEFTSSITTKKMTAAAIVRELREEYNAVENDDLIPLIQKYVEFMNEMKRQYTKENDKNKLSEREKKLWLDWKNVLKVRDKLIRKEKDLKKVLIVSLYTFGDENPPRRLQDYSRMIYVFKEPEKISKELNYCVAGEKFIFNKYKTSKCYGKQEIAVTPFLREIILKCVDQYELKNEDSLLGFNSDNGLSGMLRNIFEDISRKKVSCNILRKSFIAFKTKENKWTKEDRKKISFLMGHSLDEQLSYDKKD